MNYQKIYEDFISNRKEKEESLTGYSEKHHIKPVSLGGCDSEENLINLTAGDHYFAHLLLSKIHGGKMAAALFFMSGKGTRSAYGYKPNRLRYEYAKKTYSNYKKETSKGSMNHFYGKKHSQETRETISANRMGKASGKNHPLYGKTSPLKGRKLSPSALRKLSESRIGEKNPMFGMYGSKNPNHKKELITFENLKSGCVFIGKQSDFIEKYKLDFRNVSALVLGKRKTHKNWRVSE